MSEAALRVITGIVGAPLVLGAIYLGGWPLGLLVLVAAAAGQREMYRLMRQDDLRPLAGPGYLIGGLIVFAPLWPPAGGLAAAGILVLFALVPFRRHEYPMRVASATLFGIVYPALLLSSVLYLREGISRAAGELSAFMLTAAVLLFVWAADIGAYYVGRAWGRRPLAPLVSPNKTWEGLAGGTAAALLTAVAVRSAVLDFLPWIHLGLIAVLCALCSPLGDLLESRFKRSVQVKDSGALLPGHGGLLDRIDGLLISLPAVALYAHYIAGLW